MTNNARRREERGRSPSYPGIALGDAVSRVERLFGAEKRAWVPVAAAAKAMGYTPGTGAANVALSALRKFGLVDVRGRGAAREVRVSDLAWDILRSPDEEQRRELLRKAALTPELHRELYEEFREQGFPSEAALAYRLERERGFTDRGAQEFARQFRATLEYAGLLGGDDTLSDEHHAEAFPARQGLPSVVATPGSERVRASGTTTGVFEPCQLRFEVSPGKIVTISYPGEALTDDELAGLIEYLQLQQRLRRRAAESAVCAKQDSQHSSAPDPGDVSWDVDDDLPFE